MEQPDFMKPSSVLISVIFLLQFQLVFGQPHNSDSLQLATLRNCVQYAISNNPDLQNAKLNEEITDTTIKSKLADWYPQLDLNYNLQHSFQLQTFNFNGNLVRSGSVNTSGILLQASQNIFNRDVLLASRTSKDVRLYAQENTKEQKINIAAMVSKAFYDVILTMQQINVIDQDIERINVSLKDAYYQYQSGITDKTDYKRATISLNNAKAQKKTTEETLKARFAYLKELMGYPTFKNLDLVYDTASVVNKIYLDTLQDINYSDRIEVQQLQTQKKLQEYNLQYYKWGFLPEVSAFANYNLNYLNNKFGKLYSQSYPNSFAGLSLSIPIFQGGKRLQQIKQAQLEIRQVDNSIQSLENNINTEYTRALASYKSNLYTFLSIKENLDLANEVYGIIRLQYRAGIKTYLEVINSETDLRTAQINYYNALYQLLSSKIDVALALGNIDY